MAAAVVVLLGAGYLAVVLSYRLEFGDMGSVGDGAVFDPSNPRLGVHEFHTGATTRIAITVRNPSKLAVTIEAVTPYGPDIAIEDLRVIARGKDTSCGCLFQDAQPFRPTRLGAGEQVVLWLTLRLGSADRYEPCSGLRLDHHTIDYRILGIAREATIVAPYEIEFRAPCPSK
jgi:hypothetical protein